MSEQRKTINLPQVRPLEKCKTLKEAFDSDDLLRRISQTQPKHMEPETIRRTFIQAASRQPLLYRCDMRQVLGQFMALAYLGLPPATPLGLAHLIPFKKRRKNRENGKWEDYYEAQIVIGYQGYHELAMRSGHLKSVHCDVVLPGDHFIHEMGTRKVLEHRYDLESTQGDRSALTPRAAYAFAKLTDDDQFEVMPWHDILSIRGRSPAFQMADRAREEAVKKSEPPPLAWREAPWVRDEREMGKKTVFKRLAKWLPKCPELRAGIAVEDAQEHRHPDFGPVIDGQMSPMDSELPDMEIEHEPVEPDAAFGVRQQQDAPFGEWLIDEFGDRQTWHTDPTEWAKDLELRWRSLDGLGQENLLTHNADIVVLAQKVPSAFAVLLNVKPTTEEHMPTVIVPPTDRGNRVNWAAYPKAMQAGVGLVPPEELEIWTENQRGNLEACPPFHRVRAIWFLAHAFESHEMKTPEWLIGMLPPEEPEPTEAA